MTPPKIIHFRYNKIDDRNEIIEKASATLHMSKTEKSLLSFYAHCSSGFAPAVSLITAATHINRSQIFRCRSKLIEHGVAATSGNSLFIDWSRLKLFSTLDPRLTSKRMTVQPVSLKKCDYNIYMSLFELRYSDLDGVIKKLTAMTENEYNILRLKVKEKRND